MRFIQTGIPLFCGLTAAVLFSAPAVAQAPVTDPIGVVRIAKGEALVLGYWLAMSGPAASVGIDSRLGEGAAIRRPLLMHIAEEDGFVPKEAQAKIVDSFRANPLVEIHTYPGCDHGFARTGGQHYDAQATALAGGRTLGFFRKYLV